MEATPDELLSELKRLRRGWGIHADLCSRLGPHLSRLAGDTPDDEGQQRQVLRAHLARAADRLPDEMALAVLVELCIHPEAELRQLEERLDWLANELGCSRRTATRRADEALKMLAQELVREMQRPPARPDPDESWYVESFSAFVQVATEPPEAVEDRVIVALVDGVATLGTSLSVPRHPKDANGRHQLDAELLFGGALTSRKQLSETRFRHVIELPRPLRAGERHRYSLKLRVPPGQLMAPHYVYTPKRRSDRFDVRIRFGPNKLPASIWKLDGVATAAIYEQQPNGELLTPDRFGEVYAEFRSLKIGYAFGVCWLDG